ncbi:unnamed protein product [Eruca vesicaria subsp. sativa]|uniref:Ubiquitin-like protease family profile domain-containing protein n=1 Tax=Eruca vesicaria subsp. sativa TaxID=29727 RepID=A0ABC8JVS2_ERUVS|nr:unnamed protein product [Eruca vesicaria subsp. sativa]
MEPCDWWTPMSTVRKIRLNQCRKIWLHRRPSGLNSERNLSLVTQPFREMVLHCPHCIGSTKKHGIDSLNAFNMTIAARIIGPEKWLGNEEMDGFMYIWRVKTYLWHWTPDRVAFMPVYFSLQIEKAHPMFGRLHYIPVLTDLAMFNVGNHWIAVCVNLIEKAVEVFDFSQGRNRQFVEKFAVMIPRILKAVAPPEIKKHLLLKNYFIVEVPLKARLNNSSCDCGEYALKHLECYLLGLDLSLVDDEILQNCGQKLLWIYGWLHKISL